jgi:hypothetical protein
VSFSFCATELLELREAVDSWSRDRSTLSLLCTTLALALLSIFRFFPPEKMLVHAWFKAAVTFFKGDFDPTISMLSSGRSSDLTSIEASSSDGSRLPG